MPTNDTFEMPAEMRAFIERGMQQARAALDTWLAAAQQAAGAAQNRAASTQTGIREMGELAVGYAERNLAASFQFAQRLVQAKDAKEIADLHGEYVRNQMQTLGEQAKELSERAAKLGGNG